MCSDGLSHCASCVPNDAASLNGSFYDMSEAGARCFALPTENTESFPHKSSKKSCHKLQIG